VRCLGARFPDGRVVWIVGRFVEVTPPRRLAYTWALEPADPDPGRREEQVTVSFEPCDEGTEVTVLRKRVATAALRDADAAGWDGCLDGLAAHLGMG
jgi:uncharacterized protein YndB with AHSA1/START domain